MEEAKARVAKRRASQKSPEMNNLCTVGATAVPTLAIPSSFREGQRVLFLQGAHKGKLGRFLKVLGETQVDPLCNSSDTQWFLLHSNITPTLCGQATVELEGSRAQVRTAVTVLEPAPVDEKKVAAEAAAWEASPSIFMDEKPLTATLIMKETVVVAESELLKRFFARIHDYVKHNKGILLSTFKSFDKDSSGQIGENEFCQAMKSIGLPMNKTELETVMMRIDANRNGKIQYKELLQLIKAQESEDRKMARIGIEPRLEDDPPPARQGSEPEAGDHPGSEGSTARQRPTGESEPRERQPGPCTPESVAELAEPANVEGACGGGRRAQHPEVDPKERT